MDLLPIRSIALTLLVAPVVILRGFSGYLLNKSKSGRAAAGTIVALGRS
jgi:hypothetical protein